MAKRDAQARSVSPGEEAPATLISAAEEHTQALKKQLLESTELAARSIVGQTRTEGERRIEAASRQAQAIAETVTAIEQAEQALAGRARAFAEASKALRSELESFSEKLSDGERRLAPKPAEEPDLRLEATSATTQAEPEPVAPGIGRFLFAGETVDAPESVDEAEVAEVAEEDEDFAEEDDEEDEPQAEAEANSRDDDEDDDEDDEPPTPDQIARYFREAEEAELARAARPAAKESESERLRDKVRRFFNGPDFEGEVREEPSAHEAASAVKAPRDSGRLRLYTDVGGVVIGLGGAAALINFVLLD